MGTLDHRPGRPNTIHKVNLTRDVSAIGFFTQERVNLIGRIESLTSAMGILTLERVNQTRSAM